MSWIKPPSFLQLPAQRLGNLLPNLPAPKAKKTLQNTDDQKQSAVMLPFLAYAPWQHLSAKDSSKEASCKSCPASFPPNSDGTPPTHTLRVEVEGSVKLWQGSRESFSLGIASIFWSSLPLNRCRPGSASFWGKTVPILRFAQAFERTVSFPQSGLVSIYPLTWFLDVLYPADLPGYAIHTKLSWCQTSARIA